MDDNKERRPISANDTLLKEKCPVCGKNVEAYDAISSRFADHSGTHPLNCIVLFAHISSGKYCEGSRLKIPLADHLIREFQGVLDG